MQTQNTFKREWLATYTFGRCFRVTRQTQVEDLVDPFTDKNSAMYTNVLTVALYWNVISTISSAFLWYTETLRMKEKEENNRNANKFIFFSLTVFAACFFSMITNTEPIQSAICIVFCGVFFLLALYLRMDSSQELTDISRTTHLDLNQKILFWIGYTMTLPVLVLGANMLAQRRDWFYNIQMIMMAAGIGIAAFAAEFVYSAATDILFQKSDSEEKKEESTFLLNKAAIILRNSETEMREKNDIISDILMGILFQVFVMWCAEFPTFPANTFSNAKRSTCIVVPLLLLLPIFQCTRLLVKKPDIQDMSKLHEAQFHCSWIPQLSAVDFVARILFTLALIYDLRSLSIVDNVPL